MGFKHPLIGVRNPGGCSFLFKFVSKHSLAVLIVQREPEIELVVVEFLPFNLSVLVCINQLKRFIGNTGIKVASLEDRPVFIQSHKAIVIGIDYIIPGVVQAPDLEYYYPEAAEGRLVTPSDIGMFISACWQEYSGSKFIRV